MQNSSPNENNGEKEESFFSHLIELRSRLIRAVVAVLGIFAILCIYPSTGAIYDFIAQPMIQTLPEGNKMIATGVITPFLVPLKVTLLFSFVLALPYVLYQAWAFIAPGLYQHEKRLAVPLVISSTLLFIVGMAFCYFIVFHTVFHFISMVSPQSINFAPDIEAYLSFVMTMFIAFGITFEVPIVVLVLVSTGMMTLEKLKAARGYVIVGAFVIAAIVTPPDVLSQLLLAIPLCLLYELGLLAARFIKPGNALTEDADR
ncbi:twin-arginine translocase subunit TatC [Advenella alkanexedens]|jgi:sec-independent protein translocase protein TatC|uniref:Sec-independent protein translocase protein TatC n=1 Tax=Advenella alkanexedens TaxID=1481665 RepID=A0ABS6NRD3_9BURK|nr:MULTISPECIES: twin-arginine translocase subunit TatC [Advenella]MBV4398148.1 twin-arginine translocase subunit TatC [Advenella alkanexedens]MDD3758619.1 twin-arginine translocase subunit TatC [Advenella sp.]NLN68684.1 twin-arginine translocase subunit TatC [Alcaligenaceae bacterium]